MRQHPGISEGHWLLAKIAIEEGKPAEAADHLARYLVIKPEDPVGHNRLGRVLWEQGHLDRAVRAYRRGLQLNPLLPEAHGDLGILLVRQGELDEGIGHLRRAVRTKDRVGCGASIPGRCFVETAAIRAGSVPL